MAENLSWQDQVKSEAYKLLGGRLNALAPSAADNGVIGESGKRVAAGQSSQSTVAGIPTMYLVAGIAAIALAVIVLRKKG